MTPLTNDLLPFPDLIGPKPPFLTMLNTMLHMFFLEGKCIPEIYNHFRSQGIFFTLTFVNDVCSADPPSTHPVLIVSETQALELVIERMRILGLILELGEGGMGEAEISKLCVWSTHKSDEGFVKDLLAFGRFHEG